MFWWYRCIHACLHEDVREKMSFYPTEMAFKLNVIYTVFNDKNSGQRTVMSFGAGSARWNHANIFTFALDTYLTSVIKLWKGT